MKGKIIALTIIFIFLISITAFAHRPFFEGKNSTFESPVKVPDTRISYVVYGTLKNSYDIDFIKISAKQGETFFIQVAIPGIKGNTEFAPYIAIIGKGIYRRDKVPFDLQEGMGAAVIGPVKPRLFYEKYTQTSYDIRQSIRGEISEDGDYYVAVYSPVSGGKYSLAFGEEEKFTLIDVIKFPYTYLRVRYFFNPLGTISSVAGGVLLLYGLFRFIKYKKRR